jgi:membrane associated rhomboid family serine protease
MGFQDRDYTRGHGSYTDQLGSWGFDLGAVPPMVKRLVATNAIVFLLQIFFTRAATIEDYRQFLDQFPEMREALESEAASDNESSESASGNAETQELPFDPSVMPRVSVVQEWFELDTQKVLHGQVWRLLPCAFCHDRMSVWHILINMLLLWWGLGRRWN